METMFTIGKIVNTHGVKGEMRVLPMTEDIKRFEKLKKVYVQQKDLKEYEISAVRYHKHFVLLKFKGIETLTEAETLKNAILKIDRKDSLPLEENEYYISDLYGLKVQTKEGRDLGEIKDILYTGSNDVYVVKNEQTKKEILIPAIKQCILQVDIESGVMIVELLEGLEE